MDDPHHCLTPHVDPAQLPLWVVYEDDDLLVLNKPGWLVCHPSKDGMLSSLSGAVREVMGLKTAHLIARLDRETSGVVIYAKHYTAARRYQMAVQGRIVKKTYLAILEGTLDQACTVDKPLRTNPDENTVRIKMDVCEPPAGQSALTDFKPIAQGGGYSLVEVTPHTGRKHQIRAHAAHLGNPVAGDKIYGADETLFIEFIDHGWTPRHAATLPLPRHALHAWRYVFEFPEGGQCFEAPIPVDFAQFCHTHGLKATSIEPISH